MGDLGDFGDLLGGLFGSRRRAPKRGADVETALHLSFEDAVRGVTTSVNLPTDAQCRTCKGSGAAPGTTPVECERCHGRGVLDDDKGMFSLSTICPVCQGRGARIETPCPSCHGSGREASSRSVKVRIPPGVEDGQRIRVKGKGQPGQQGAPAGDLYVVVHVSRDPRFGRKGRNLTTQGADHVRRRRARHHGRRRRPSTVPSRCASRRAPRRARRCGSADAASPRRARRRRATCS